MKLVTCSFSYRTQTALSVCLASTKICGSHILFPPRSIFHRKFFLPSATGISNVLGSKFWLPINSLIVSFVTNRILNLFDLNS